MYKVLGLSTTSSINFNFNVKHILLIFLEMFEIFLFLIIANPIFPQTSSTCRWGVHTEQSEAWAALKLGGVYSLE